MDRLPDDWAADLFFKSKAGIPPLVSNTCS
jgi:hypothetical protein